MKYRVRLLRDTTLYLDLVVEADDEAEAEEEAQLTGLNPGLNWELSMDRGAPYVADDKTEEMD